jgi:pimeloyl-ACP methyl ester carboxylesterase
MPRIQLSNSPLLPGINPVTIDYLDQGSGSPLFLLHGGWGYGLYPFNRQAQSLSNHYRIIIPRRSGYPPSSKLVDALPSDFHYRAAIETLSIMDSLGIERASFWGHSDGAVIAAILGFTAPERVNGLILEAFHYYGFKPASRKFFETLADDPGALDSQLSEKFSLELGSDYWRQFITAHAKAWLQIAKESDGPNGDLYQGRLTEILAPALFIHGRLDPRTEPGELDAVREQLPQAEMQILDQGYHSPHSEVSTADSVTHIASKFLQRLTV